jgi:hypothetical protein
MYQSSLYVSHIPNREIRIRVKDSDSFYNFRASLVPVFTLWLLLLFMLVVSFITRGVSVWPSILRKLQTVIEVFVLYFLHGSFFKVCARAI